MLDGWEEGTGCRKERAAPPQENLYQRSWVEAHMESQFSSKVSLMLFVWLTSLHSRCPTMEMDPCHSTLCCTNPV